MHQWQRNGKCGRARLAGIRVSRRLTAVVSPRDVLVTRSEALRIGKERRLRKGKWVKDALKKEPLIPKDQS